MIKLLNQYFPRRLFLLLLGENLLILAAVWGAMSLRLGGFAASAERFEAVLWRALCIAVLFQVCLHFNDLYNLRSLNSRLMVLIGLVQGIGAGAVLLSVLYLVLPQFRLARGMAVSTVLIVIVILVAWRLLVESFGQVSHRGERCLLVGSGSYAGEIVSEVRERRDLQIELLGVVEDLDDDQTVQMETGILGRLDDLDRVITETSPDRVVVALRERRQRLPLDALLKARARGIQVEEGADLYEKISGRLPIESIRPSWLIFSDGFSKSVASRFYKRLIGIGGAIFGLILLSPVMVLVAVAVRIDSPGPILFKQERVGLDGRTFKVLKFRSMRADAEKGSGPVWAQKNDPRVTRIGHWLRLLRLDELPQLINVLRGDMNFVGPRPERPAFVEILKEKIPFYDLRHSVRPGVTGWAQVCAPYGASIEDSKVKLEYDLFYIKNMSMSLDLFVLFQTTKTMILGRGAR